MDDLAPKSCPVFSASLGFSSSPVLEIYGALEFCDHVAGLGGFLGCNNAPKPIGPHEVYGGQGSFAYLRSSICSHDDLDLHICQGFGLVTQMGWLSLHVLGYLCKELLLKKL